MAVKPAEGIIYLVGAGPGDPGLISVKGARLLEQAQVVVYDYLSNPKLLEHAPPDAEKIYVGKKAQAHTLTQEQINALLVEKGKAGLRVVRLKGGDPYVFGRGGEEAEALVKAGVRFEEVPGITAAIGGTAYAGIPVTHRDFNSSFTFITGHEKEERSEVGGQSSETDIDWGAVARMPCVAFYMGVKSLPRICQKLIENGMDPSMPAACIRWATTPRQRTVVATVATLAQEIEKAKLLPPALTIIGKVVTLRETMNWFERRPLFRQTIVVTRTRHQASDLSDKLAELGANVLEAPTIELHPSSNPAEVDAALSQAGVYDWIVFTSANGVEQTKRRLLATGKDARAIGKAKIAAVGQATADAIERELCLNVDLLPKTFVAEALAEELLARGEVKAKKFLLLRADIARPMLREKLQQEGAADVRDVAIYETIPAKTLPDDVIEAIAAREVNWVTFTSSSTARNFAALLGSDYKQKLIGVKIASIGPITTGTLKELGLEPTIQAEASNIQRLVEVIRVRSAGVSSAA